MVKIDIIVLKRFINVKCEIFLKNNFKYTGYIKEISGDTVSFIDKYNKEIPIESSLILMLNPIGDEFGY